jgi:hypothetical protein
VHLVLTACAKGEPIESQGDISSAMPPGTLVWVVKIHAQAINWNHGTPAGYVPPAQPGTDSRSPFPMATRRPDQPFGTRGNRATIGGARVAS